MPAWVILTIQILIAIGAIVFIFLNIRVIPQGYVAVVEKLGEYCKTWRSGPHFKMPFVHRIAKYVSLKEQVEEFRPQAVITKDNVNIHIDTICYYQVTDAKLYTYGVDQPLTALENLASTNLRTFTGTMSLEEILNSRDIINTKLREILDNGAVNWGIQVNRVELKNVVPPRDIQDAIEREMRAEREAKEARMRAETEKETTLLVAQGRKEAAILAAQAQQETEILDAQSQKQREILLAEGKAEAIVKLQTATAEGIKKINEAKPSAQALAIKSMETMEKMADGKATKLILPTNMTEQGGFSSGFAEFMNSPDIPDAEDEVEGNAEEVKFGSSKVAKKVEEEEKRRGLGRLQGRFGTGKKSSSSNNTGKK